MKQRRWIAWILAVVMAACLLAGCGLGSEASLLALDYASINRMLKEDGLEVTVSSDDTLNQAVAEAAQALDGAEREESESDAVKTQIARQTGTMPLICEAYDRAYWPNAPLGNPDRHEKTMVSFAQQLYESGNGRSYTAALAGFTTKDGDRMLLLVMSKGR